MNPTADPKSHPDRCFSSFYIFFGYGSTDEQHRHLFPEMFIGLRHCEQFWRLRRGQVLPSTDPEPHHFARSVTTCLSALVSPFLNFSAYPGFKSNPHRRIQSVVLGDALHNLFGLVFLEIQTEHRGLGPKNNAAGK